MKMGRIMGLVLAALLLVGAGWGAGREPAVGTASPLFQESLQLALSRLQSPTMGNILAVAEVPKTFNIDCAPPGPGPSPGGHQIPTEQPTMGCTPTAECPITEICPTEDCFPVTDCGETCQTPTVECFPLTDCGPTCIPTQECYTACANTQGCVPITDCEPICHGGAAGPVSAEKAEGVAMKGDSGAHRLAVVVGRALKRLVAA